MQRNKEIAGQRKIMLRYLVLILFMALNAGCNSGSSNREKSTDVKAVQHSPEKSQVVAVDGAMVFLLNAAASDFHRHENGMPIAFRNVNIGYLLDTNKAKVYVLCGQFIQKDKDEWIPFATIKTTGYEQWIGAQALAYCNSVEMIWHDGKDLSLELKRLCDELNQKQGYRNTHPQAAGIISGSIFRLNLNF